MSNEGEAVVIVLVETKLGQTIIIMMLQEEAVHCDSDCLFNQCVWVAQSAQPAS